MNSIRVNEVAVPGAMTTRVARIPAAGASE